MNVNEDNDLPLMSNTEAIRVKHYMLDLSFDFESHTVEGQCILFCQPMVNCENVVENHFTFILDARHLLTSNVEEVTHEPDEVHTMLTDFKCRKNKDEMDKWFKKPTKRSLSFQDEDWCLKIWKPTIQRSEEFPKVVKISWKTSNVAKSLLWRPDQLGHLAVFTPAAAVNNRSLFPCQEPPIALASWQALISVRPKEKACTILCTGDQNAIVDQTTQDHYFFTQMILPMSTFAIAIGQWTVLEVSKSYSTSPYEQYNEYRHCRNLHEPYPCHIKVGNFCPLLPTRLIGPEPLVQRAFQLWKAYIPACLESAYELLGPHPFTKLDIVIVPRCYSGLGLASPSLMFISQSLLLGNDGGMDIRIAHEICHNWFGLLIGALDWTEEWLSEGFATFAEDFVHNEAMKKLGLYDETKIEEISGLRRLLRFQTLTDELESTPIEHQIIRPMGGQELRHSETQVRYVKNGQNPQMAYTQVHYLKGFFLLHHLCDIVGQNAFFRFLRHYIHDLYHGKLVHSTDFLTLFFETFKDSNTTVQEQVEDICQHWLDTATLPTSVQVANEPFKASIMVKQVQEAMESWSRALSKTRDRKRKFQQDPRVQGNLKIIKAFSPEQLLMFLELLIRCPSKLDYKLTLEHLKEQIGPFDHCNADIQHRLCEIVVLGASSISNLSKDFVTQFLREHQAMGIYLYSEMASSTNSTVNKLAKKTFQDLSPELDPSTKHNISELLPS